MCDLVPLSPEEDIILCVVSLLANVGSGSFKESVRSLSGLLKGNTT